MSRLLDKKLLEGKNFIVRLIFEPRDLWIGCYVKEPWWEMGQRWYAVYICIVPTLPIFIAWHI